MTLKGFVHSTLTRYKKEDYPCRKFIYDEIYNKTIHLSEKTETGLIASDTIKSRILTIRGVQVMLDSDLVEL